MKIPKEVRRAMLEQQIHSLIDMMLHMKYGDHNIFRTASVGEEEDDDIFTEWVIVVRKRKGSHKEDEERLQYIEEQEKLGKVTHGKDGMIMID